MSAFSPATDRTARCARRETPSRAPEGLRGGPGTEGSCAWKSYSLLFPTHGTQVHKECCDLLASWGYRLSPLGGGTLETTDEVLALP